jgi:ankyrin repeat protein
MYKLKMEQTIELNQSEETQNMTGYEFITACAMGQMETAKQLLVENPEIITTNQYMRFGFRQACYSGNLDIADWVLSVKPNIEDLDKELEKFLHDGCYQERLDIIEWVLRLKKNIMISAIDKQIIRKLTFEKNMNK